MFGLSAGQNIVAVVERWQIVEVRLYGQNSSTIVKIAGLF